MNGTAFALVYGRISLAILQHSAWARSFWKNSQSHTPPFLLLDLEHSSIYAIEAELQACLVCGIEMRES
jgi:hypothetical protein